jgi:hypothetical protein
MNMVHRQGGGNDSGNIGRIKEPFGGEEHSQKAEGIGLADEIHPGDRSKERRRLGEKKPEYISPPMELCGGTLIKT